MEIHLPSQGNYSGEGGLISVTSEDPQIYAQFQAFMQANLHHPQLGVITAGREFIRGNVKL